MGWPLLSPAAPYNVDTTLGAAPTSLTVIDAATVWICGLHVVNNDTAAQSYRLTNSAGVDIVPTTMIPAGGAMPLVPGVVAFMQPCVGLKEVASSANVKRHLWGYK